MPKIRITSVQAFGVGVTTEYVESNREVVRRVLTALEDKNLLWRSHGFVEDPEPSRVSAEKIRSLLNAEINNVRHGGKVEASFKKIRTAARVFCGDAGLNSAKYLDDQVHFNRMLASLRTTVGQECAYLAALCNLTLEQHVIDSLPPQDLAFHPWVRWSGAGRAIVGAPPNLGEVAHGDDSHLFAPDLHNGNAAAANACACCP